MKVSAQYAQEHLDDLLAAADSGEEVEIVRPGRPSIRLVRSVLQQTDRRTPEFHVAK